MSGAHKFGVPSGDAFLGIAAPSVAAGALLHARQAPSNLQ
jgi:hypothetical protein